MRNRPLEKDTCRDYVVPALSRAGWLEDQVIEQYAVTDGRIVPRPHGAGRAHRRERELRADYLLEYSPGFAVAVVEAKRLHKLPGDGLQQAKRYAELLDLPLAYSTNGRGIVEHDYDTGEERNLTAYSVSFAITPLTTSI
jgi:type I restriction enzyme R subunit